MSTQRNKRSVSPGALLASTVVALLSCGPLAPRALAFAAQPGNQTAGAPFGTGVGQFNEPRGVFRASASTGVS